MKDALTIGTEIYYTGDMANDEGFGRIVGAETNKWGSFVDAEFEDGRTMHLSVSSFSPEYLGHGGTRFVTLKAYRAWRETNMARMRAEIAATA